MSVAEAFVTVRPDMNRFGSDLQSGLGRLAGVAGKAMAGVGAAITGVAVAGVREFSNLQRGMNEAFTLLPGISQQAMGEMTDDVRRFSREMGVLPNTVVPALYQSLSAGVPPDNVFEFLEVANRAAIGGVTELETAVDGISSVVNSYGDEIISAGEASDLMFTAVRLGKTTFDELSRSLFNILPTASALGVDFEDVTAAMARLTSQGVPTSVATRQLRQLFVELSKEGSAASDVFKEMAGVSFQEFIAAGGNTADALDIMRDAAEDSGVSLQDLFGSVEAGAAALALAGGDTDAYREALDEMAGAAGATEAAHAQMDTGLSRSWERIKANLAVALGEIGEALAPIVQAFADWAEQTIPSVVDAVSDFSSRFGSSFGTASEAVEANSAVMDSWASDAIADRSRVLADYAEFPAELRERLPKPADFDEFVAAAGGAGDQGGADFLGQFKEAAAILWEQDIQPWLTGTVVPWLEETLLPLVFDAGKKLGAELGKGFLAGAKYLVWDLPWEIGRDWGSNQRESFEQNSQEVGSSFESDMNVVATQGVDGFVTAWDREGPTIESVPMHTVENAAEGARDAAGQFYGIGESMGTGMETGLSATSSRLASVAIGVVTGALNSARGAIRAQSPSQLFAEKLGEPMGEGVLVGLQKHADAIAQAQMDMVAPVAAPTVPPLSELVPSARTAAAAGRGGVNFYGPVTVGTARDLDDLRYQMRLAAAEAS